MLQIISLHLFFLILGYFSFLALTIFLLKPSIRKKLKSQKSYEVYVHHFVVIRQILLFFLPLVISYLLLGATITSNILASLIVLGLSINVFWIVQFPLLNKAKILVTFDAQIIDELEGDDEIYEEKTLTKLTLTAGKLMVVRAAIYNLGFSTYKNCTIIIYFGKDFIIPSYNDRIYGPRIKKLDFNKPFSVQRRHGGVAFSPKDSHLTLPPQEVFLFPFFIWVPKTIKSIYNHVRIQFYSENSWGITNEEIPFNIIEL